MAEPSSAIGSSVDEGSGRRSRYQNMRMRAVQLGSEDYRREGLSTCLFRPSWHFMAEKGVRFAGRSEGRGYLGAALLIARLYQNCSIARLHSTCDLSVAVPCWLLTPGLFSLRCASPMVVATTMQALAVAAGILRTRLARGFVRRWRALSVPRLEEEATDAATRT